MVRDNAPDIRWFEAIYEAYAAQHFRAGRKILGAEGSDEDVSDLLQDVFLLLWKKREEMTGHPNIGGWIMMALKYRAVDLAKGKRRRAVHSVSVAENLERPDSALSPEQELLLAERMQEIRRLLGEENAALLIAYTLGGHSARELGQRYGLSETNVYKRVSRMRKHLAVVMMALLLAVLAVCGAAYCVQRGVLNFNEDMGIGPAMVSQQGAQELVEAGVKMRLELEHVVIDVLETAYDGHELRVVYGVTSKAGPVQPAAGVEGAYMVPGAQEDGVHTCDYIRVNGQDAYFDEAYEAAGENPNQALYYLQTNLTAWGIDTTDGKSLTIGLPMLPRDAEDPEGMLEFTTPADVPQALLRRARLASAETGEEEIELICAEFSPLSGYVEIRVKEMTGQEFSSMTGCVSDVLAQDGSVLTGTQPVGNIREDDKGVTIGFALMPTHGEWPKSMKMVIYMDDGSKWTLNLAFDE